jgi:rubrerythrin
MNIFEFAMKMETDGELYYREMAAKTENTGLRNILLMLAEEEVRHFKILKKNQSAQSDLVQSVILTDAKNVFQEMKDSRDDLQLDSGQLGLYQEALKIEKTSRDFYHDKADETSRSFQKELFLILAAEEDKHVHLLEHIIEFINRPAAWLENAEFYHLEEY